MQSLSISMRSSDHGNKMSDSSRISEILRRSQCINKQTITTNTLANTTILIQQQSPKHKFMTSKDEQRQIELTKPILSVYQTLPLRHQIGQKYRTFANWNYKDDRKRQRKSKRVSELAKDRSDNMQMMSALIKFATMKGKEEKDKKKLIIDQLPGVKEQRRQRFKKFSNPLLIIRHYVQKEDYQPTKEATALMDRVIKIRHKCDKHSGPLDLQRLLMDIYKAMNIAVDYNQMYFLCLLVMLTGDICYEMKDFKRSLYFYNQARIASTYADLLRIKTQVLLGMGRICLEMKKYDQAMTFFKKCLQYCWKTKNIDLQLVVYDEIGKCYYYQGYAEKAIYFHNRYIQGEMQLNSSAIKKISLEMLGEYNKRMVVLQRNNLTSLFIEYLNLPIKGFNIYPPSKVLSNTYDNYDQQCLSPRKNRPDKHFRAQDFPEVMELVSTIFNKDLEFHSQIPCPDVHRNFVAEHKYGRPQKEIEFIKTSEYHKLVGMKASSWDLQSVYKYPLNIRINKRLNERRDPRWWENMVYNTKKDRAQKVGEMRSKIFNSHQSYAKYQDERRRTQSLKSEKIKENFNKTLLNFIDPLK